MIQFIFIIFFKYHQMELFSLPLLQQHCITNIKSNQIIWGTCNYYVGGSDSIIVGILCHGYTYELLSICSLCSLRGLCLFFHCKNQDPRNHMHYYVNNICLGNINMLRAVLCTFVFMIEYFIILNMYMLLL